MWFKAPELGVQVNQPAFDEVFHPREGEPVLVIVMSVGLGFGPPAGAPIAKLVVERPMTGTRSGEAPAEAQARKDAAEARASENRTPRKAQTARKNTARKTGQADTAPKQ